MAKESTANAIDWRHLSGLTYMSECGQSRVDWTGEVLAEDGSKVFSLSQWNIRRKTWEEVARFDGKGALEEAKEAADAMHLPTLTERDREALFAAASKTYRDKGERKVALATAMIPTVARLFRQGESYERIMRDAVAGRPGVAGCFIRRTKRFFWMRHDELRAYR